jgi:hypothetical protein
VQPKASYSEEHDSGRPGSPARVPTERTELISLIGSAPLRKEKTRGQLALFLPQPRRHEQS